MADWRRQVATSSILVAAPASGGANHTIESWSVDTAANSETPHDTASFTVAAPVGTTGTVIFRWNNPSAGSFASFHIDGLQVAFRTAPGWDGWYTATRPVRAKPYALSTHWYDQDSGDEGWSSYSVVLDRPGKRIT